jgi:hypothetical protein
MPGGFFEGLMTPTEITAWLSGYEAGMAVTLQARRAEILQRVQRHRMKKKAVTLHEGIYLTSKSILSKKVSKKEPSLFDVTLQAAFDRFWLAYPRHVDKKRSFKEFRSAAKRADVELVISSAAAFALTKPKEEFVPYASTWLRNDRWVDFPPTPTAEIVRLTPEKRAEILAKLKRSA